jgi:hypothetical protein
MRNGQSSRSRAGFTGISVRLAALPRRADAQTSFGRPGRRREVCPFSKILFIGHSRETAENPPMH